jgi:hypothetical protein
MTRNMFFSLENIIVSASYIIVLRKESLLRYMVYNVNDIPLYNVLICVFQSASEHTEYELFSVVIHK